MKKYLLISIIVLSIISVVVIIFFLSKKNNSLTGGVRKNNPEIEKLVTISQAEISAFVFVTQESQSDHRLNINLTPFLNLNITEKEIKSLKISNFKSKGQTGEIILIHPTDIPIQTASRTFLFTVAETIKQADIISNGDSIEYEVVSQVSKYNQVRSKDNISPYFGIIIKDIGMVNYDEIFKRDGVFDGSKYLEYSGISLDKLDAEIQFDISIEFTDSSKYVKRFKSVLKGELFATETAPLLTLEVVE